MDKLTALLNDIFPFADFNGKKNIVKDKVLDSLDLFRLIGALEDTYKISIPFEEMSAENFDSVEAMYALVGRLSGK